MEKQGKDWVSENKRLNRIQLAKGQRRKNTMETRLEMYSTNTNRILCNLLSLFFLTIYEIQLMVYDIHKGSSFLALSNVDEYG